MRGLIAGLALLGSLAGAATPDWPKVEQHAVEFLQEYVRLRSVNPPADTRETAKLLAREFAAVGLEAVSYTHLTLPTNREV